MFTPNNRSIGVRVANSQLAQGTGGPANTVKNVAPLQMIAVEYFNDQGEAHVTVALQVGGKLYIPPNAEEWAAALTGAQKWFQEAVFAKMPSANRAAVPTADSVDILNTGSADASAS